MNCPLHVNVAAIGSPGILRIIQDCPACFVQQIVQPDDPMQTWQAMLLVDVTPKHQNAMTRLDRLIARLTRLTGRNGK